MDKVICINLTNVLSATFNIITNDTFKVLFPGRGGTWVNFCCVCAISITSCSPTSNVSSDPNEKSGEFLWAGARLTLVLRLYFLL